MAVWSTHRLSELPGASRLDAEFWLPEYEKATKSILAKDHDELGNLVYSMRKGIFHAPADSYVEEGVPLYRSSNVGEILMRDTEVVHIPRDFHKQEGKTALTRGDIVLSKTAKEGASIVNVPECNINQDVVGIQINTDRVNAHALAVFLNVPAGKLQLRRWFQGEVQYHLTLTDARRILVPVFPARLANRIEALVHKAEEARAHSKVAYRQAEDTLLSAIGTPKEESHASTYVVRKSLVDEAQRWDSGFFQPAIQRLRATLSQGSQPIHEVADVMKERFSGGSGTFNYIEIGDVDSSGRASPRELEIGEAPSRATWIVHEGDVITSTVRPNRRLTASITAAEEGAVCSSGFVVLRPRRLAPEVLLVYLRSPPVTTLLGFYTTSTMYPSVPLKYLLDLPIPDVDGSAARKVVSLVAKSRQLQSDAEASLMEAKELVSSFLSD